MKKYNYQAKTFEEAKNLAMSELMEQSENLYIKELETKVGLFNKKVTIEVIRKDDVVEYIKELIKDITKSMGLEINLEVKKRDDSLSITIYSENNSILIGKNGRTIDALSTIVKQAIYKEIGNSFNFILDVGEYKLKQQRRLERLAKNVAREVGYSKVEAKLEPMNSYERRLIHNILTNNKKVYTESVGEEPNRCVVIKPRLEEEK
jgi:spoIIIJ-associated protein